MLVNIEQGSDAWLELRRKKVTATDIGKIIGVSPWGSSYSVFLEKIGEAPPFKSNPAIEFGNKMEPIIREVAEEHFGEWFPPAVAIQDWALASLDGINSSETKILEIKTCGVSTLEDVKKGLIPEHYKSQAQFAMFCVPTAFCVEFVFFCRDEYVYFTEKRDNEYIENLHMAGKEFFDVAIVCNIPPALTESDSLDLSEDEEWAELDKQALEIYPKLKELEKQWKALKARYIEISDDGNCHSRHTKLTKHFRSGPINTDRMLRDGIDIEAYRESPRSSTRLTVNTRK